MYNTPKDANLLNMNNSTTLAQHYHILKETIFLFADLSQIEKKIDQFLSFLHANYPGIISLSLYEYDNSAEAFRRKAICCQTKAMLSYFPELINLRLNKGFKLLVHQKTFFNGKEVYAQDRVLADRHQWELNNLNFFTLKINNLDFTGLLLIIFEPTFSLREFDTEFFTTLTQYLAQVQKRHIEYTSLAEALKKAEAAVRVKSAFLSNMSQEIRTPVNSIVGFSDLLADPDLTTDQREEFIGLITQSARSLVRIFDNIIDASKVQAGELNYVLDWINWQSVFNELVFYAQSLKKSESVRFVVDRGSDTDISIHTDAFRLKQVISNLLENSFKFTESGTISLGYKLSNLKELIIYVKDTGPGIPPEQKQTLFDFFTATNNYTRQSGSTGLGLALAKNIIELLGGSLSFESETGKGTTFYVKIPATKISKTFFEEPIAETQTDSLEDKTILVVEDVEVNYLLINELLTPTKAKVIWAKNGAEAVEIHRNQKPDIILMDLQMPVMNGYDAIRIIRSSDRETPIIAQTAFAMNNEKEECFRLGVNDFLTKPIRSRELLASIMRHIR